MPIDPFKLQTYDIAEGMEFVALWTIIVFAAVLFFSARAQYSLMNAYDVLKSFKAPREKRIQAILEHIKRIIFSVLGYQGERRERQSLDELDHMWVLANFGKIFSRFCIFYFVYIWALILTTRALLIDPATGHAELISYTSKQLFGFLMIAFYIASNATFDILSIYFTLKHLEKVRRKPRLLYAALLLLKNLVYCFGFFLLSQLFSNLIWPLKTNIDVSLSGRLFSPAIAFWPYAFIVDANSASPQFFGPIFPGQLLITGTVFLPTVIVVMLFFASAVPIYAVGLLKRTVKVDDLAQFGFNVGFTPDGKPVVSFRCVNAFTVGLVAAVVGSMIFEWTRRLIFS